MPGGVLCFVLLVCLGSIFLLVGLFGLVFSPTGRQPARKLDGEPGSLCVRLVHVCAKSVCASVHGSACV